MSALEQSTKTCSKCMTEKALNKFNRKSEAKDGLQSYCRECALNLGRLRMSFFGQCPEQVQEPRIPIAPLKALILRWANENDVGEDGTKQVRGNRRGEGTGWRNHLAELSGLHYRTLYKIFSTEGWTDRDGKWIDWVSFDTADKLTTAMECNEEWTEGGSLNPWYGPLSVKRYERHLAGVE